MECFHCEAYEIQEEDQRRFKCRGEACQFQDKEVRETDQRRVRYRKRKTDWWSRLAAALDPRVAEAQATRRTTIAAARG
eukprot:7064141-Pyramimonas_sp.AAC.1